jgi:hypothetical protein
MIKNYIYFVKKLLLFSGLFANTIKHFVMMLTELGCCSGLRGVEERSWRQ